MRFIFKHTTVQVSYFEARHAQRDDLVGPVPSGLGPSAINRRHADVPCSPALDISTPISPSAAAMPTLGYDMAGGGPEQGAGPA